MPQGNSLEVHAAIPINSCLAGKFEVWTVTMDGDRVGNGVAPVLDLADPIRPWKSVRS